MSATSKPVFKTLGYATLFAAGLLLVLFLRNLRSRLYYHGPDYGFLFWLFAWSAIAGIGLVCLRKWAVILLFFPGVATAVIILVSVFKTSIAAWAVLVNLSFTVFLLAIPMLLLHYWNDLHW
jgi:hypothetical protein